jgi:hypothetical protein
MLTTILQTKIPNNYTQNEQNISFLIFETIEPYDILKSLEFQFQPINSLWQVLKFVRISKKTVMTNHFPHLT